MATGWIVLTCTVSAAFFVFCYSKLASDVSHALLDYWDGEC